MVRGGDPMEGLVLPEEFQGTGGVGTHSPLHKKVIGHPPGTMNREDAHVGIVTPGSW
jgi:hypothetical protein